MDAMIMAVASARGGSGKTVLSVLLGGALAATGSKVLLAELSLGLRSADIPAGVGEDAVFDLGDLAQGRVAGDKVLAHSPVWPGLSLALAPFAAQHGPVLSSISAFCATYKPLFDYILLDLPSGFGPLQLAAARAAHRLLLVETPEPAALRGGRALLNALALPDRLVRLLINRIEEARLAHSPLHDLDEMVDGIGARLLGAVPESAQLAAAAQNGRALPRGSREEAIINAVARRIMGEDVPLILQ